MTTNSTDDRSNAAVRPPIVWLAACLAALGLDWLLPLPLAPTVLPAPWTGAAVFALALALLAWAIVTMTRAGTNVPTSSPTLAIVADGPYRFTRNPIYLAMLLGLLALAIGAGTTWALLAMPPFLAVIRYGVIAREEVYLERKFGERYLSYKARVRRWL